MIIDVTREFKMLDGTVIKNAQGNVYLLRMACADSLLNPATKDENLGAEDKVKYFTLAMKIYKNNKPDLTIEELALLKKRIGVYSSVLIVGQAFEMLDNAKD